MVTDQGNLVIKNPGERYFSYVLQQFMQSEESLQTEPDDYTSFHRLQPVKMTKHNFKKSKSSKSVNDKAISKPIKTEASPTRCEKQTQVHTRVIPIEKETQVYPRVIFVSKSRLKKSSSKPKLKLKIKKSALPVSTKDAQCSPHKHRKSMSNASQCSICPMLKDMD